jgi:uncharacterized membrane protein YbjE (DUF340 family)
MSLTPLLVLAAGILLGFFGAVPVHILENSDAAVKGLIILLCFVIGMDMGKDPQLWTNIRSMGRKAFTIPAVSVIGSLLGGLAVGSFIGLPPAISSAASVGSGYYSLTTVIMKQLAGPEAATLAFISNLLRELLVITATPLLVRWFGKNGTVGIGGATAMDTTLPFILKSAGKDMAIAAFVSGVVLTVAMPVLVPLCYKIF